MGYQAVSAASQANIVRFTGNPQWYPPNPPDFRKALWQGISQEIGFRPTAVPTARTAFGDPITRAISE